MNLLTDKWIPVLRARGADTIAPYEVVVKDNPVLSLNAPRPDFNGALAQLLIGLLQTALHDLKINKWQQWRLTPPSVEELKLTLMPLKIAFEFSGDGPLFMQDFDLLDGEKKPISNLFIEQPGEQTLNNNTDHFIKRDSINQICISCAALGLFTLQINAPSGGKGHRTSLRGGGPLTTLIISDSEENKKLWNMLWLNVLPKEFNPLIISQPSEIISAKTFPWLAPTRTSETQAGATYPNKDANNLQAYWCMPRRIRLNFENNSPGECDLCGEIKKVLIKNYITKNYGVNYVGTWRHPLSPYRYDKDKLPIPLHPQPGGLGYKYWQAITIDNPATVITTQQQEIDNGEINLKIWAFGYDMDNAKARCWYENIMPFYHIKSEILEIFRITITEYIETAKQVLKYLYHALKETNVHIKTAETDFWQATESAFYVTLDATVKNLTHDCQNELQNTKETWLKSVRNKALLIFDRYANLAHAELRQLHHLAIARNGLRKNLFGQKIRTILQLEAKEART